MRWLILASEDGTEAMFTSPENIAQNPQITVDFKGNTMTQVMSFEADSFEEAKVFYNDYLTEQRCKRQHD